MTGAELFPREMFEREHPFEQILAVIERDESVAIWAPRYSGRTTLLRRIEAYYKRQSNHLAVYTLPNLHLDPNNRDGLFSSIANHIDRTYELSRGVKTGSRHKPPDWNSPDALREFVTDFLIETDLQRLVVLLDDCDQLLSTSLVDLIRALRVVQAQRRKAFPRLRQLSVVVAGAVSFRNLKLLEKDELSPFDDWEWFTLDDLSLNEASEYLSSAFGRLELEVDPEALTTILEYGGGDLNRLNHISSVVARSTIGPSIEPELARQTIEQLINNHRSDPSSSYMISVITHDPRCLDVLAKVAEGQPKFLRNQLDQRQDRFFRISNPELSGGFLLDRDERRLPRSWRFRNRYAEEVLNRHFDTATMMRAYLDLGRPVDAMVYAENLERSLAKSFRDEIYDFSEAALRDVVEARWEHLAIPGTDRRAHRPASRNNRPGSRFQTKLGDRVQQAFFLIAHILSDIFGFEDAVLYEKKGHEVQLTPINTLPAPPFSASTVEPIALEDLRRREVRVFVSGLYTVEIEGGDRLKIVIPLKDFQGRATGVLSIRSKKYMEGWATLFVRIPIVERSLNLVWRKLSRVEAEQIVLLEQAASLESAESGVSASSIPIFGVTEFNTELHRHLDRNLKRFSVLDANFLNVRDAYIYDQLLSAMKNSLILVDVTKINNNVFFELGLAIGLNRPGFLVAEENLYRIRPRMIDGRGYLSYGLRSPLGVDFLTQVRKTWLAYQRDLKDESHVHILQRKLPYTPSSTPYVIAIGHNEFSDDSKFHKAVEEAARKRGLELRYIWKAEDHPCHNLSIHPGTILQTIYSQLLHARAVIASAEDLETAARASHFVAIGIAKGLEERLGAPRVLLCRRQLSPAGGAAEMPSDLRGLLPISIDPSRWRQFSNQLADLLGGLS